MAEAAEKAVAHMAGSLRTPPLLLPSSLDRGDALVHAIRRELRAQGSSSSVAVPRPPFRFVTRTLPGKRSEWRAAGLLLPDAPGRDVLLPSRLLAGEAVLYVTHVNAVARTGPFQLDLLTRYVHPRLRIRQVIDPDRAARAVETNLAMRPAWSVIGGDVPPGIVVVTRDLIVGELIALCLAERFFDRGTEFANPWEDRVVQRATELELGAATPGEIRIELAAGEASATARAIVDFVQERIGIVVQERSELANDSRPS